MQIDLRNKRTSVSPFWCRITVLNLDTKTMEEEPHNHHENVNEVKGIVYDPLNEVAKLKLRRWMRVTQCH